jgi:hypothetical protein
MNWIVRAYDTKNNVIDFWAIKNRTESQAMSEAEADIYKLGENVDDWSMTQE